MVNSKNTYTRICLMFCSFLLLLIIFKMIHYLLTQKYIVECFSDAQPIQEDIIGNSTSHTVNLPLTTTYSCKNFCGPNARCSITGQQCFTDIDCPGCQPYSPPLPKNSDINVPGNDDAGKLTWGVTPQYSSLTSGYGTKERIITPNVFSKPSQPNFGVNTWSSSFNKGQQLFDKRYKPTNNSMPNYSSQYSLTGEFISDGPYAANAYLP